LALGVARGDEIVTTNGQSVIGSIVEESPDMIRVRTAKGALMTLPRTQIKTLRREELSVSEAEGDLAVTRKDYYRAQQLYERMVKDGTGSAGLAAKLRQARTRIAEHERTLFESLLQEALKASREQNHDLATSRLRNIIDQAPPDGPYAAKAHRALACENIAESLRLRDRVEYANAIQAMRSATEADPTMGVAFLELAVLLENYSKDTEGAIDTYRNGIELAKVELDRSDAATTAGATVAPGAAVPPEEEAFLPKEVRLDKARLAAHRYALAMLLYKSGRKNEAAQEFLNLIEEKTVSQAKAEQAVTYIVEAYTDPKINRGLDHAKVLEQLDRALQLKPRTAKAWMLKGRIYLEDGKPPDALDALNHAIEIDPTIPTLHSSRAEAYLDLKEPDLARHDLQTELETRPKFALLQDTYTLRCELGRVMTIGVDYDAAIEQYAGAVEIEADQLPAHLGRAKAYRLKALGANVTPDEQDELLDKADKDIEAAFVGNEDDLELVLEKGSLIVTRGQIEESRKQNDTARRHYDEAQKFLGQVIKDVQDRQAQQDKLTRADALLLAEALSQRGDVDLSLSNKNRAREDFEAAVKARPDFALAYGRLAKVTELQGNFDEARTFGIKALELDPKSADYELSLAVLLHRHLKAYGEAIDHYEAYRKKGGPEPRVPDWIRECRSAMESASAVVPAATPQPVLDATNGSSATLPSPSENAPAKPVGAGSNGGAKPSPNARKAAPAKAAPKDKTP
jgi:tetratricopeptide (TPR) repeat protein